MWRRLTTWVGGAVTALGAAIFLADMTDDASIGGMLFLAGGIALVFVGHAIASAINEPDEMEVTMALVSMAAGPLRQVAPPPAEDRPGGPGRR